MNDMLLSGVRKIAVLRASALGDFLFALPALDALRRAYPRAEIVYLGKAWHKQFVPGRVPSIDRVVVVPPCAGVGEREDYVNGAAQLRDFFRQQRRENFDLAVQMHGGGRFSNVFINRLEAAVTVGSCSPDAEPLNRNIPFSFYQNEVLRCLELVSFAGASTSDIVPRIELRRRDVQRAREFADGNYIVLHPGASDPRRRWPAKLFGAVASHFCGQRRQVFITGAEDEQEAVHEVVHATQGRARSLHGLLDLGAMAAFLAGSDVVVSNDTGPLHLARAVGAPTVGLYWCGNFITAGPMQLDRHPSLLSWIVACPTCGVPCISSVPFAKTCGHNVSFIQDIGVDDVIAATERVLQRGQGVKLCRT